MSQGWVKTRENREHYEGSPGLCVLWVDTESQKQNFTENPREYQGGQLSKNQGEAPPATGHKVSAEYMGLHCILLLSPQGYWPRGHLLHP